MEAHAGGRREGATPGETAVWRSFPDEKIRVEGFVTQNFRRRKPDDAGWPNHRQNPGLRKLLLRRWTGAAGATTDFGSAAREDAAENWAASSLFGAQMGT